MAAALTLVASGCLPATSSATAETLFQVSGTEPVLAGDSRPEFDAREYELFQKTQVALVKSDFVLRAAVRDPAIGSLDMLTGQPDKVAWLAENLEVGFVDDSEILSIRLSSSRGKPEELRQLVDAVAKAYMDEVVYDRRQKDLNNRDMLARGIDSLRQELERKMQQVAEQEAKSDGPDPALGLAQAEVDVLLNLWRELTRQLESMELNTRCAPDRVRKLQDAIVHTE